ncbi:MAG: N-acetyltransferase [Gemmatimonadetes bacterium]|nr:N-acetyltransferase [Gemmatimonadota bacterium]
MVAVAEARIRLATPDDGAALAAVYRSAVVESVISFEYEPPDGPVMASRVVGTLCRLPWLVCELAGRGVIGYAYAGPHRERAAYQWSVDVSAYVHEDIRRAGVARALYISLFAILVMQGFRNAFAGVTLPNDASVGLHRAVGFTPIGIYRGVGYKLGSWHDVAWFERQLAGRDLAPAPPVSLPQLTTTDIEAALAVGVPHLHLSR